MDNINNDLFDYYLSELRLGAQDKKSLRRVENNSPIGQDKFMITLLESRNPDLITPAIKAIPQIFARVHGCNFIYHNNFDQVKICVEQLKNNVIDKKVMSKCLTQLLEHAAFYRNIPITDWLRKNGATFSGGVSDQINLLNTYSNSYFDDLHGRKEMIAYLKKI